MNYEIVLATSNPHKVEEMRKILSPHGIVLYGLSDLNATVEVEETGQTFYENALLKAMAVAKITSYPVIADDSGLEILSLNKEPGIHTARYAKELGGYDQAFKDIFKRLENKDRSAQFVCDIVLVNVDAKPLLFEGTSKGKIATKKCGNNGFGYDPIFIPEGYDVSFAELDAETKNAISHRGKALKKLLTYLRITGKIKK